MIRKNLLALALACTAFSLQADVKDVTDEATLKDEINNNDLVVVKFYASWCGPCKQIAPDYKKIAQDNSGKVKFLAVEDETGLAQKNNVTGYPTVVFYKNGQEVSRLSGGRKKEAYERELGKITGGTTTRTMKEEAPMPKKMMKKKPAKKPMKKKGKKKAYVAEQTCNNCETCG